MKSLKEITDVSLKESGYPRIMQAMRGLIPNIKTVGIVTAENPKAVRQSAELNKLLNIKLEADLKHSLYGYKQIKGKYGEIENPFIIFNIVKNELLEIGKRYSQETVISGMREQAEENGVVYDGMTFELIHCDDQFGKVDSERKVFVNINDAEDFFSEVKGRKFIIPFFDGGYSGAEFAPKSGFINKKIITNKQSKTLQELADKATQDSRTGYSRYNNRGCIKNIISEINDGNKQ